MAIFEELVCLVNCQAPDLNDSYPPALATDRQGNPAVVPPGEVWHINRLELMNPDASLTATAYIWTPPNADPINATNTSWLWVPLVSVAVNSIEVREGSDGAEVLHVLEAGSSIWTYANNVCNVLILGWRYQV